MYKFMHVTRPGVFALGVILVLLSLIACSTTTTTRQTYTYSMVGTLPDVLHSGDQLTLTWKAIPDPSPTVAKTTPTQIVIRAIVAGPFSSASAAKQSGTPAGNNAGLSVTIYTDAWTNKVYVKALQLPKNLPPGYYTLFQSSLTQDNNGTSSSGIFLVKPGTQ